MAVSPAGSGSLTGAADYLIGNILLKVALSTWRAIWKIPEMMSNTAAG